MTKSKAKRKELAAARAQAGRQIVQQERQQVHDRSAGTSKRKSKKTTLNSAEEADRRAKSKSELRKARKAEKQAHLLAQQEPVHQQQQQIEDGSYTAKKDKKASKRKNQSHAGNINGSSSSSRRSHRDTGHDHDDDDDEEPPELVPIEHHHIASPIAATPTTSSSVSTEGSSEKAKKKRKSNRKKHGKEHESDQEQNGINNNWERLESAAIDTGDTPSTVTLNSISTTSGSQEDIEPEEFPPLFQAIQMRKKLDLTTMTLPSATTIMQPHVPKCSNKKKRKRSRDSKAEEEERDDEMDNQRDTDMDTTQSWIENGLEAAEESENQPKRIKLDARESYHQTQKSAENALNRRVDYTKGSQLPQDMQKYWYQRYRYFQLFDQGIKIDKEGWYSVTPERIAYHIAQRCATDVIIDAFCGVGGNAIQFALTCHRVIAIDIDPVRLMCAKHNAKVYGVEDRIEFICGDFMTLIPRLKADVVFLSPPWGGPGYLAQDEFDLKRDIPMDGEFLFNETCKITKNIAYYLPRNSNAKQIGQLAGPGPDSVCEIEKEVLNHVCKAWTAYYGELAVGSPAGDQEEEYGHGENGDVAEGYDDGGYEVLS
ncbi:Trimethylguanosine synthase [Mortierella claussenii]|nr:Trimethylguanosine synthase [Mortierella claussenii]